MPLRLGQPVNKIYVGIDPGAHGGMAALGHDGMLLYDSGGRPSLESLSNMTDRQKWDWLARWEHGRFQYVYCLIEKVGGFMPRKKSGG